MYRADRFYGVYRAYGVYVTWGLGFRVQGLGLDVRCEVHCCIGMHVICLRVCKITPGKLLSPAADLNPSNPNPYILNPNS